MDYIDKWNKGWEKSLSRATMASLQIFFSLAIFFYVNPTFINPALIKPKDLQKIGQAFQGTGKVLVQRAMDPNWWPMNNGDDVYLGDRIYALEGSQLGIQLIDGRQAWVRPNSIISLGLQQQSEDITLEQGQMYVNFIPGQRLLLANGDIIVANDSAQIYSENISGRQDIKVTHGSVSLYNRDKQLVEELFKFKTIAQLKEEFKLASPFGTIATEVDHQTSEVHFRWDWIGDPMLWALEVAADAAFSEITYQSEFVDQLNFIHKLPAGDWFWRIKARRKYSEKIYQSAGLEFTIIVPQPVRTMTSLPKIVPTKKRPPRLLPPPTNIRFSENLNQYTRVDWDYPHASNRFFWQISCGSNFKQKDLNAYTGQNFFVMKIQQYYQCLFRVRSYSDRKKSYWSKPVRIDNIARKNE